MIALVAGSLLSLSESAVGPASRRLDLAGAVAVTSGMALVVFGIVSTDSYAWTSPRTITTLAGGAAILVSFVVIEARFASNPIVPLRTFRRRSLTLANAQSTIAVLATIATAATQRADGLGAPHLAALTQGYTRGFLVIAAISVLGAVSAALLSASTPGQDGRGAAPDERQLVEVTV